MPVIFLTVQDDELSKVRGLELGADDYIVKSFGHLELLARIRSVLRRTTGRAQPMEHPYRSGDLSIDFAQRHMTLAGEPVRCRTPLKFGAVVVEEVPIGYVRVVVENRAGSRAEGWGAMFLMDLWAWPGSPLGALIVEDLAFAQEVLAQ